MRAGPELDDATVAYIVETRRVFEDLRQVAAQLAGLLVLEAAGASSGAPEHPILAAVERLYQESVDGLQRASATQRARRHHECLMQAAQAVGTALTAARLSPEIDPVLAPLRSAFAHLRAAGSELPGFDMLAFEQGCCGVVMRSAH